MQNHDTRCEGPGPVVTSHCEAEPEAVAKAGDQPADKAYLSRSKSVGRLGPMQAEVTPAARRSNQRRTQLITKTKRRDDVAIPGAAYSLALSGRVQGRNMARAGRQGLKLIDVLLTEFIVEELICDVEQRLFSKHPGEQQRPWVCLGKENRVDRKQRVEASHDVGLKGRAKQT